MSASSAHHKAVNVTGAAVSKLTCTWRSQARMHAVNAVDNTNSSVSARVSLLHLDKYTYVDGPQTTKYCTVTLLALCNPTSLATVMRLGSSVTP